MPGPGHHILTHEDTVGVRPAAADPDAWITTGQAARELCLRPTEFDLAVRLGRVRTTPAGDGGSRRVDRSEIERLRADPGFPDSLRHGVRAVGTTEGAAVTGVPKTRFTRLARLGLLVPVRFYANRYRAVVWLYLAEELRQFGTDEKNAPLLTGRMSEGLRDQLDAGLDLRPRNFRARQLGFLLRQADDPWARAGAVASLLDPLHVSQAVKDPYDRSRLLRFREPLPPPGDPGAAAARIARDLLTARDPDEIAWMQADLIRLTREAREHRPAPRRCGPVRRRPRPDGSARARGLLARLRRGNR